MKSRRRIAALKARDYADCGLQRYDYSRDSPPPKWGSGISLHGNPESVMSALGQKRTSRSEISMSGLPLKADIAERGGDVRFVPKADMNREEAPFPINSASVCNSR
jgi:hypothetical protein